MKPLGRLTFLLLAAQLLGIILLTACDGTAEDADTATGDYPNGRLLVDTEWVAERTAELDTVPIVTGPEPGSVNQ